MKKERKANFELLRIISMLLIVIYHYSDWGGIMYIETSPINRLIGDFINIGGKLGVNLFVLISGYFLINSKFKLKKLIKVIFEVWFYSVAIAIICLVFKIGDLGKGTILRSLMPISYNMYWFASAYIAMYLLSPFINKLLNNINRENYKMLIIVLGIILSVIPTFIPYANICTSDLVWFIYMYIIAAYIQKYNIEFTSKHRNYLYITIIIAICMFGVSAICFKLRNVIPVVSRFEAYLNSMNSFTMLLMSVSMFMYFRNINIKSNKLIDFFAKSSFAVYLIHINAVLRVYLFKEILKVQDYYNANSLILILYILGTAIAIYLICTIIDTVRRKALEEPIFKITKFDKYIDKIEQKINT